MNEHILFVMKWLDDPTQFTKEEVAANRDAAYAVYAYAVYDADATYWIDEYFKVSGEDKQEYIRKLK